MNHIYTLSRNQEENEKYDFIFILLLLYFKNNINNNQFIDFKGDLIINSALIIS